MRCYLALLKELSLSVAHLMLSLLASGGFVPLPLRYVAVVVSGFYPLKSGIKIGCNFPPSFGLRFPPIFDSSFPNFWAFFSFTEKVLLRV